ncbi:MAG: sensor histidine kinase [Bacillota bacterium]|nr:sensor histidine kinase [Bacillota bacterium]
MALGRWTSLGHELERVFMHAAASYCAVTDGSSLTWVYQSNRPQAATDRVVEGLKRCAVKALINKAPSYDWEESGGVVACPLWVQGESTELTGSAIQSSNLAVSVLFAPEDLAGVPDEAVLSHSLRVLSLFYAAVLGLWATPERLNTLQARDDERKRIARDIHDELSQLLAAAFYRVEVAERVLSRNTEQAAKELSAAKDILQDLLTEIDRLVHNLKRPPPGVSLSTLVRQLLRRWEAETGIRVDYHFSGDDSAVNEDVRLAAYRIIQEACANVRKHSQANMIQIEASVGEGLLKARIADDGVGFETSCLQGLRYERFGLQDMRERAECAGGRLEICSAPRQGTVILVELPLGGSRGRECPPDRPLPDG